MSAKLNRLKAVVIHDSLPLLNRFSHSFNDSLMIGLLFTDVNKMKIEFDYLLIDMNI